MSIFKDWAYEHTHANPIPMNIFEDRAEANVCVNQATQHHSNDNLKTYIGKREREKERGNRFLPCAPPSSIACHVAWKAGNPERAGRAISGTTTTSGVEEVTCKVAGAASSFGVRTRGASSSIEECTLLLPASTT
uniref:Uncharacterized protein n=1 Tax=Oryza nivara TaxID=4536 RepID=A0A0E0FI85_ORYNI